MFIWLEAKSPDVLRYEQIDRTQTTDRWPEVVGQADKWQTDRQTGGQEDR
jgi:hypothetical protein